MRLEGATPLPSRRLLSSSQNDPSCCPPSTGGKLALGAAGCNAVTLRAVDIAFCSSACRRKMHSPSSCCQSSTGEWGGAGGRDMGGTLRGCKSIFKSGRSPFEAMPAPLQPTVGVAISLAAASSSRQQPGWHQFVTGTPRRCPHLCPHTAHARGPMRCLPAAAAD